MPRLEHLGIWLLFLFSDLVMWNLRMNDSTGFSRLDLVQELSANL